MAGFKKFLMNGNLIVVAVGLVMALAFSTLITAFTTNIINPIIARFAGSHSVGLGWQLGQSGQTATYLNLGTFISAVIYFIIYVGVIYFIIVVPYRRIMARKGQTVFGDPPAVKTCPECLSEDLPAEARKCKYCGSEQSAVTS